ncbi:MAG: MMPL family transporter [Treponema sp.]|nr:MMPL family transporter [Treponema sp.]
MKPLLQRLFRHPWLIIVATAGITAFFAFQLPHVQLDNNNLRFVPKNDQAQQISRYIDDTFGSSLFILVGLERNDGTVFDQEFLERVRQYVDRIYEFDIVGDINSIINTDYITSEGDAIVVEKLVNDDFTGDAEEIAELKRRLLSWDIYKRALISDDFTSTQILIPLVIDSDNAGDPEVVASYLEIRDIARSMFDGLATVYVTGMPVISGTINEAMHADLVLLIPLVIVVLLIVVFIPLKRISFVVIAMLAVVLAVIWSTGAMPLFNIKMSVITTVLPVILMAVGSSYGIHIIIHYIEDADKDFSSMTQEEYKAFVIAIVDKLALAIFLAAITTLMSFLSYCVTRIAPIREFGYFSAFGVFASFFITLTLTPAILMIRGPHALHRLRIRGSAEGNARVNDTIADFFVSLVSHTRVVLIVTAVIAGISLYGVTKLVIDNIFVEYFKPDTDIVRSDTFIREKFGGSKVLSVVVQAETPEMLLHPDTLSALDGLGQYLMTHIEGTGKVMGFTDMIKRVNQVFNADEDPAGLKPAISYQSAAGEDDAGFGFGFDDNAGFGFDDAAGEDGAGFGFGGAESGDEPEAALFETHTAQPLVVSDSTDDSARDDSPAAGGERTAYYEIPADPKRYGKTTAEELQRLISNYLVLISGSVSSYANDPLEPTAIKSTVQLRTLGQKDTDRVVDAINAYTAAHVPANVTVIVGGSALVEASTNLNVVQSVWTSMLIALISVFVIITVSNRSAVAGIIAVIPLVVLILINFAIMAFVGIKLNIGTALIASLTMGIGIDYTIHYIEAYKREYRRDKRTHAGGFLKKTYLTCGVAILTDAASVAFGFLVLLLSRFTMLADFGLLVAISMTMSALAGLIIVPALLLVIKPKFIERREDPQDAG